MSGGKHGPNRLGAYLDIHSTVMQQFLGDGFVLAEELLFSDLGDGQFLMDGYITCEGGLRIDVSKRLTIVDWVGDEPRVKTTGYSYSAILSGYGSVFRYDSPHPDHNQFHHVHRYRILEGDVHGDTSAIEPSDEWPTLGEVMRELSDWYYAHVEQIRTLPTAQE